MAQAEPMDLDHIKSDCDKENAYKHNNALPRVSSTEKGYEELDVSELNMKLRYSFTPASPSMSKSFSANCVDSTKIISTEDNMVNTNHNLTQSLNSAMSNTENILKSPKSLPLQSISTDQYIDLNRNSSVRCSFDASNNNNNIADTVNGVDVDNLSLPSTSSSLAHTPEATTPTKDVLKVDGGSPIMRGLKSVLNLFRSSQSPIPPTDDSKVEIIEDVNPSEPQLIDTSKTVLASTPIRNMKSNSPSKDSLVFNEDLQRELLWKEDSEVFFKEEKIPIHKLFPSQLSQQMKPIDNIAEDNGNMMVEAMDISFNKSVLEDGMKNNETNVESDSEFLDCETTFNKTALLDINETKEISSIATKSTQDLVVNMSIIENNCKDVLQVQPQPIFQDLKLSATIEIETPTTSGDVVVNYTTVLNETVNIDSHEKLWDIEVGSEKVNETINIESPLTDVCMYENSNVEPNLNTTYGYNNLNAGVNIINETINIKASLDATFAYSNVDTEIINVLDNIEVKMNETVNLEPDLKLNEIINLESSANSMFDDVNTKTPNVKINETIVIEPPLDKEIRTNGLTEINYVCEDIKSDLEKENFNQTICIDSESKSTDINLDVHLPDVAQISQDEKTLNEVMSPEDVAHDIDDSDKSVSHTEQNQTIVLSEIYQQPDTNINPGMLHVISTLNSDQIQEKLSDECLSSKILLEGIAIEKPNNENINLVLINNVDNKSIPQSIFISQDTREVHSTLPYNESDEIFLPVSKNDRTDIESSLILKHECDMPNNDISNNEETKVLKLLTESPEDQMIYTNNEETKVLKLLTESPEDQMIYTNNDNKEITLTSNDIVELTSTLANKSSINYTSNEEINNTQTIQCHINDTKPNEIPLPFEDDHQMNNDNYIHVLKDPDIHNTIKGVELVCEEVSVLSEVKSVPALFLDNSAFQNISDVKSPVMEEGVNDLPEDSNSIKESTLPDCKPTINVTLDISDNDTSKKICNNANTPINAVNESYHIESDIDITVIAVEKSEVQDIVPKTYVTNNLSPHEMEVDDFIECKNAFEIITENSFEVKSKIVLSPPGSPKIVSKGYNFDFDQMDNPFATKTKIRLSPTPETPSSEPVNNKNILGYQEKSLQNRGKLQPTPKTQNSVAKKGMNDTTEKNQSQGHNSPECVENIVQQHMTPPPTDNIQALKPESRPTNQASAIDAKIEAVQELKSDMIKSDTFKEDKTEPNSCIPIVSTEFIMKSVFNLPEIDDKNFNPFATRSKMGASPVPSDASAVIEDNEPFDSNKNNTKKINGITEPEVTILEPESPNKSNVTSVSSQIDRTVKEINTEDEDTVEGPFFEAEELAEFANGNDIVPNNTKHDIIACGDFPKEQNDGAEKEEMFIDAEAFEFLLNQNKGNIVVDSGKESLFLKFDPLFAKRMSSDSILTALNNIKKKQSTPKKIQQAEENILYDESINMPTCSKTISPFDQIEDPIVNPSKPTMVVNPAVSAISSRKSVTPPKRNRQSLTFTSPAMAVIDRLLSLSGNMSAASCNDTSLSQICTEQYQTDLALTHLREMLAEKEIHVHTLRSERKELTNRLATLESQVNSLESESEDRLRKITTLNSQLTEKTKLNKTLATTVEEYERTIATLVAELEQDKRRNAEERMKLIRERDEQTAHLASMEISFNDLHSKYEKSKQIIYSLKANEDNLKKSLQEFEDNQLKIQNNYELLKQHATSKLNHANQELEKLNRTHEAEVLKLKAMIKRKDLHVTSLEETLAQKTKANEELTAICDELINKVG